jgi:hypothetical protein
MRSLDDHQLPIWLNSVALAIWLAAAVGAFLPFAVGTSPFDAVMRQVPNDEGNWWHILIGAPFFLAFPMIWLRLRAFISRAALPLGGRRALWIVSGLLMFGTLLVEAPFLAHRAGTSEPQRLAVIAAGLGIPLISISRLVACRRTIGATRAHIAVLTAAYLANASLCLIVYGEAKFGTSSRSGWYLTMAIVWPMALELVWVLFGTDSAPGQAEAVS